MLLIKQERFCKEYLKCGNATKAAIKAGYSKKTARNIAGNLLTKVNIKERLAVLKQNIAETIGVTPEMIANELRKIAFVDTTDTRSAWITLKDFNELSDDTRAAISEVQTETRTTIVDDNPVTTEMVKIKFHSKIGAIQELNKMLGYNAPEQVEISLKKKITFAETEELLPVHPLVK